MKKRLILAIALVLGMLFLVACGNGDTAPTPQPAPAPGQGTEAPAGGGQQQDDDTNDDEADEPGDAPATGDRLPPEGTGTTIVIYSNSFTDERLEWLTERAAEDGFSIQGVAAGGGATADRLIAERHNPIADVVFGLNVFLWQSLIDNNVIVPYVPAWADEIEEGLNHPDGYYHALVIQAILLTYDTAQVDTPPTDWLDLWTNPAFHGLYQFETALTGGTTRMVLAGILGRFIDPDGHLGISEEGWEHIRQYYAHGYANTAAIDLFVQIADPGVPVTMGQIWHAGIPMREAEHGITAGWVVPDVGVPFVVEGIAEVNGSSNPEEARRFIEWFGQASIQMEWQERFDSLPANIHAQGNLDEFQRTISELPIQDVDWGFVAENFDSWAEHIILTYMP
ncbi:MAG: ABC transporter substrate-binding protein [Oscillospiraceae bacterium]|nr:ABC transporter substrate-binding protein [Oscillospiraceae bacterium]